MSRINLKRMALLLLLGLLLTTNAAVPVLAQEGEEATTPKGVEEVFRAAQAARNASDAEAYIANYAEGAVTVALPPPPGSTGITTGLDDLLAGTNAFISRNFRAEITDFQPNGDSATFTALITEDEFTNLGVAPIEFTGTVTVQDGKIIAETWVMRAESLARIMAAITAAEHKSLAQRLYDEVYNGQATDVLGEVVAPDALEEYEASVDEMQAAFPELAVTVDHLLVEGDQVVAVLSFTGTPEGGEPITWSQVDIHSIDDGLLAETSHFGGPPATGE